MKNSNELKTVEVDLLLEGIYRQYGYDFRNHNALSIRGKISRRMHAEGRRTISGLQEKVFHDSRCLERLLLDLSKNGDSFFGSPNEFQLLGEKVIPQLRTYPSIRVWQAGCSTGEELYSIAIFLQEEGLYSRSRIYATDIHESALKRAKEGVFPQENLKVFQRNYVKSGGKYSLSNYYKIRDGQIHFDPSIRENILFAEYNLATDQSFNEFNLILSKNKVHYYNKTVQERIFKLFYDSLCLFGFLVLGNQDSFVWNRYGKYFEELEKNSRLYKKIH